MGDAEQFRVQQLAATRLGDDDDDDDDRHRPASVTELFAGNSNISGGGRIHNQSAITTASTNGIYTDVNEHMCIPELSCWLRNRQLSFIWLQCSDAVCDRLRLALVFFFVYCTMFQCSVLLVVVETRQQRVER